MGPGLITGASDDDPSGIATYSQAGAAYGYGLIWTLILTYPLMCAIQQISAEIGRVTGKGLAGNLRHHSPAWLLYGIVGLLLIANCINIGADLGAMAASLKLLIGGPELLYVGVFAAGTVLLEVFVRYSRYVSVLKWLTISLFAYVATLFVAHVSWPQLAADFLPHTMPDKDTLITIVAIFGTTISPYLFFWQAQEEVEDMLERRDANPLIIAPQAAPTELRRIRIDTYVGMAFSNVIAIAIMVTVAATLHVHGVRDITTSSQAAQALLPIAGPFAFGIFAIGIIGTGLLALPVLAGSAAYAIGETFNWPVGLAQGPLKAKAFYATIAIATFCGAMLNVLKLDPVKALFWSAVLNGVVAVPVMAAMMIIASRRAVMGKWIISKPLLYAGWSATAVMAIAAIAMFATSA